MTFPAYPDYKDSGVQWLGQVPEHWHVKRINAIATLNDEVLPESTEYEYEIAYVDIGSVSLSTGIQKTELIKFKDAPSRARRLVKDGDVIVSTVRTYLKAIAPIVKPQENLVVSTGFAVIRGGEHLYSSFSKYALQSNGFVDEVISRSTGVSYPAINSSEIGFIKIPVPSFDEQKTIANFLDYETAKIDALIAEQEKLIELLNEKRQSIISNAVCRGLDPNVPMKDSGVEWLGMVPEHWEINKVSRNFKARKGANAAQLTKEYCGTIPGDYPVFSGQTENEGVMSRIDSFEFDFGEDGCLFSTTVGAKAMTLTHITGKFSLSQNCMVIFPTLESLNTRFYFYHLTPLFIYQRGLIPEHMQASFRMEDLYSYKVAIPPLIEQIQIAKYLNGINLEMTSLKDACCKSIEYLKERRSALISAAVTGQIDVRNFQS